MCPGGGGACSGGGGEAARSCNLACNMTLSCRVCDTVSCVMAAEAEEMLRVVDENDDGEVDFAEFEKMMLSI